MSGEFSAHREERSMLDIAMNAAKCRLHDPLQPVKDEILSKAFKSDVPIEIKKSKEAIEAVDDLVILGHIEWVELSESKEMMTVKRREI